MARQWGVADRYVPDDGPLASVIAEETGARGVDLAMDCAGSADSVRDAIASTVAGGRVVLFGVHTRSAPEFDINLIVLRDLVVYGSVSDRYGWPEAIELAATGKLRIGPLITHRFALEDAPSAYEAVQRADGSVMKAVILL